MKYATLKLTMIIDATIILLTKYLFARKTQGDIFKRMKTFVDKIVNEDIDKDDEI